MQAYMMILYFLVPTILFMISWYRYKNATVDTNEYLTKDNIYYAAVFTQVLTIAYVMYQLKPKVLVVAQ